MKKATCFWLALVLICTLLLGTSAWAEADVYAYTEEDIWVDASEGHKIPATLTVPVVKADERFPAVVMCHGGGSNRHEVGNAYDVAARMMAEAGIATIRFDFIGNGDSQEDHVKYNKNVAVSEAMACQKYIAALDAVDESRIGIMGWSMGGGITLLTAARNDVFKSVVTWAGAAVGGPPVSEENYALAQQQGYFVREFDWRESMNISLESIEIDKTTDVMAEISNIKVPILATVGMDDVVVKPEVAIAVVEASTHDDSMVLLLKSVDHTYNALTGDMHAVEKATIQTIEWFLNTL